MTTIRAAALRMRFLRSSSSWRRMFVKSETRMVIANTNSIWKPSNANTSAAGPRERAQIFKSDPAFPSCVAVKIRAVVFLSRSLRDFFRFLLKF